MPDIGVLQIYYDSEGIWVASHPRSYAKTIAHDLNARHPEILDEWYVDIEANGFRRIMNRNISSVEGYGESCRLLARHLVEDNWIQIPQVPNVILVVMIPAESNVLDSTGQFPSQILQFVRPL
jgi:hypothetical protein